jgi:hypothetical protein
MPQTLVRFHLFERKPESTTSVPPENTKLMRCLCGMSDAILL